MSLIHLTILLLVIVWVPVLYQVINVQLILYCVVLSQDKCDFPRADSPCGSADSAATANMMMSPYSSASTPSADAGTTDMTGVLGADGHDLPLSAFDADLVDWDLDLEQLIDMPAAGEGAATSPAVSCALTHKSSCDLSSAGSADSSTFTLAVANDTQVKPAAKAARASKPTKPKGMKKTSNTKPKARSGNVNGPKANPVAVAGGVTKPTSRPDSSDHGLLSLPLDDAMDVLTELVDMPEHQSDWESLLTRSDSAAFMACDLELTG